MTFALTIPVWVLWVIGIPIVIIILFFAVTGVMFFIAFSGGIWK
jgi:hypothetical protein